jgi:hypothetical protein
VVEVPYAKITVIVEETDGTKQTLEFPKTEGLTINTRSTPIEHLVGTDNRISYVRTELNFDLEFKGLLDPEQGVIYRHTTVHPPAKEVGKE